MHPPFCPRLAARTNPKDGIFAGSPQELRELSAAIDADGSLRSRRRTLAEMLMQRGENKRGAYAEVDSTLYDAWERAEPADRLQALRRVTRQMKDKLEADTLEASLTVTTEAGDATEAGVEDTAESGAESRLSEKERERKLVEVLDSYGLTLELYKALIEGSVTKAGELVRRTDDAAVAQAFGRSTKDIATLRAAAIMIATSAQDAALMTADDLDDLIDQLS